MKILLVVVVAMHIIGNAVCFPFMKYWPLKSRKQRLSSFNMKSVMEINLENNRELLKIKDFKEIETMKVNVIKETETMKMTVTKEIEAMKIADSEKERRLKFVSTLAYVIVIFILGAQLRDGLLGRATTFNSIVNELKDGILKLTKAVQVLVGGAILEFAPKNLTRARSFLCKLFLR